MHSVLNPSFYFGFQGHWLELACDKSGSRVFDKLWLVASVKQKESIAEELRKHEHRLQGDYFGKYASLVSVA